jgi:hypothetical protein
MMDPILIGPANTRSRGTKVPQSGPTPEPDTSVVGKQSKRKQHLARSTHPPPAKKKSTKKSTSSTKDLLPRHNTQPPGPPRQYPIQRACSLVVAEAPPAASVPSPAAPPAPPAASVPSPAAPPAAPPVPVPDAAPPVAAAAPHPFGLLFPAVASRDPTPDLLERKNGQRLSDKEIEVYSDAVAHRKSIGKIYTHPKKGVVLEPVKADSKPTGDSLNDAEAWTAFGLADGTNLFGEDTHLILHDTGNKTENDRAKVLAFRRFMISIRDHIQLSSLADLIPDPEGGMVARFFLVIRGLANNHKMQALNILMLCWSYEFHTKGKPRADPNATYQPGYTDKVVRQIFKCCKFLWWIVNLSFSCLTFFSLKCTMVA